MRVNPRASLLACLATAFFTTTLAATVSVDAKGGISPQGVTTDNFESSIKLSTDKSTQIKDKVEVLRGSLDNIEDGINIPRDISNLANDLDETLETVNYALIVVGVIPPIRIVCTTLRRSIGRIRPGVQKVETSSNRLDSRLKNAKKNLDSVDNNVGKFRTQILSMINIGNILLVRIRSLKTIIENSPESIKWELDGLLDNTTGLAIPVLDILIKFQDDARDVLMNTINESRGIRQALEGLTEISNAIEDVRGILEPIRDPLRELQRVLDAEVCAFWVCLSIGGVFRGIDSIAGWILNPLLDLAYNIIQPILDALNLPSDLPSIPGLDKLDELENLFAEFEQTLGNSLNFFYDATGNILEFSNQLTAFDETLAGLESRFSELEPSFCVDYEDFCPDYVSDGLCSSNLPPVQLCRKSCGMCN